VRPPHGSDRWLGTLPCILVALCALSGCGGDGGGLRDRFGLPGRLSEPTTPRASECSVPRNATARKGPSSDLVPRPGVYIYNTRGRRTGVGDAGVSRFDRHTKLIVTRARRLGELRCLRLQQRYSATLGDTATVVVRGGSVLTGKLVYQAPDERTVVRMDTPLEALSMGDLEAAGSFTARIDTVRPSLSYKGPGVGRYASQIIGRRVMSVGARRVRTVGVQSQISFAGADLRATEQAVRWVTPDYALVVREAVDQTRQAGADRVRLVYTSRLRSLAPVRR
jgi:hypothetical protein